MDTTAAADPATPPKNSMIRSLAIQAAGAVLWGVFFSTMPIAEVLAMGAVIWIPFLVWREFARSKKHGFLGGFLIRAAVVGSILVAAALAPVKYEDRLRLEGLSGKHVSLEELSKAMHIAIADDQKTVQIVMPSDHPTVRQSLEAIRKQTGVQYRQGTCGNGMTVLWGNAPMGGYYVVPP